MDQPAFPLTATDGTTLRFEPVGIVVEFDSLENRKYHQVIHEQSGGIFQFNRK